RCFLFVLLRSPPRSPLSPYTTLFRSNANLRWAENTLTTNGVMSHRSLTVIATVDGGTGVSSGVVSRNAVTLDQIDAVVRSAEAADRKSTRLNSSHVTISYAVVCLRII